MKMVLEPAETNPFLEPFYRDPQRYAFPVQMFYLVNRWRQQEAIRQQDLFEAGVVSDYLFQKDRLFAEKTLPKMELELYDRFAGALGQSTPRPDLVVWLHAPLDTVMQRIAKRQAPGEHRIQKQYVTDLNKRYERMFAEWTTSPVLRIDNTEMDYSTDPVAQQYVLGLIRAALAGEAPPKKPGTEASTSQTDLFGSP